MKHHTHPPLEGGTHVCVSLFLFVSFLVATTKVKYQKIKTRVSGLICSSDINQLQRGPGPCPSGSGNMQLSSHCDAATRCHWQHPAGHKLTKRQATSHEHGQGHRHLLVVTSDLEFQVPRDGKYFRTDCDSC